MTEPRVLAIGTPHAFRGQVARSLQLEDDYVDWLPSVTAAEESVVVKNVAPHVLVLSHEVKDADALGIGDFIAQSSPTTAVVLVREQPTPGLLAAAMRAGIRDILDRSADDFELGEALRRAIAWSQGLESLGGNAKRSVKPRGQIISIFSSKGGVGKTFLASNLAAAIAKKSDREVALLDFDLKLGDVFSYWGQEPTGSPAELQSLATLDDHDAIVNVGTAMTERLWAFGVQPDPAAEPFSGDVAGKVLRTLRSTFDYTIVDATNDYSDQTVAAFDMSDEIWLVTGLDVVGMRHLLIAMETLQSLGVPRDRLRVVLNRADSQVGPSLADVERVLKVKIDLTIPSSELVPRSLNKGVPAYFSDPASEVARSIDRIADKLLGTPISHHRSAAAGRKKLRAVFGIG
ncbi:MAG: AAA family ATPase [Actinobacteria bacterium]|nr:AAA family ATPase [Actinomycetota bacterium]